MRIFKIRPPVLWLAGLGLVSGLLSAYPPTIASKFTVLEVSVYQGVIFGLAIGFGIFRWGNVSWIGALLAFIVTIAAWIAAVRGFYWVTDGAKSYIYLGGLAAGAIGAAGTILGGAVTIQALRNSQSWMLTVFVGAIAGLLVVPQAQSSDENFLLLFVVWQTAVAASIGYALIRRNASDS